MARFDPATYLDASMQEPSQQLPPLPVGNPDSPQDGLYLATIGEVKCEPWESTKAEAKVKSGLRYVIPLEFQIGPKLGEALGGFKGDKLNKQDTVMLRLTESGMIDNAPGANPGVFAYREAVDLNKKGDTFNVRMLQGRMIRVQVTHDVYQNRPVERFKVMRAS